MKAPLFSVRMRASRGGVHISGAERLVNCSALEKLTGEMALRALRHSHGPADSIRISIDQVSPDEVLLLPLPNLTTFKLTDFPSARAAAAHLLEEAGVSPAVAQNTIAVIAAGASPEGNNMRGAMLVDADNGLRLEQNPGRGVRVSRMDLTPETERKLRQELASRGIDRPQVREALVLSGKVLAAPGVIAELCWSDDPDYTGGYVASPGTGYVRFPALKPFGDQRGGRAFFVRGIDSGLPDQVEFLEKRPVLFDRLGRFHPDRDGGS